MEIAVISDLHMSTGNADVFMHNTDSFVLFLKRLEENFEKIILLGDIFDTLIGKHFCNQKKEFWEAVNKHKKVSERIFSDKYIYVYGNHDIVAKKTVNAVSEYYIHDSDFSLLCTHGHEYDWLAKRARLPVEFVIWIGGRIKEYGLKKLYDILAYLDEYIGGTSDNPERCLFTQWAVTLASKREFDCIITGHTHKITARRFENIIYMNSGACMGGQFEYITINTKTQVASAHAEYL